MALFTGFAVVLAFARIRAEDVGHSRFPAVLEPKAPPNASTKVSFSTQTTSNPVTLDLLHESSRTLCAWIQDYRQLRKPSMEMLNEGLQIAEARRTQMLKMIQEDPDAVLNSMIALTEYAALPGEIRSRIEQPFSVTSNLDVIYSCPNLSYPKDNSTPKVSLNYWTRLNGEAVELFPGRGRCGIQSKSSTFLSGVRLDGIAAVHSKALWVIPEKDAEAIEAVLGLEQAH